MLSGSGTRHRRCPTHASLVGPGSCRPLPGDHPRVRSAPHIGSALLRSARLGKWKSRFVAPTSLPCVNGVVASSRLLCRPLPRLGVTVASWGRQCSGTVVPLRKHSPLRWGGHQGNTTGRSLGGVFFRYMASVSAPPRDEKKLTQRSI